MNANIPGLTLYRFPNEIIEECISYLPIIDLAVVMAAGSSMRTMGRRQISIQVNHVLTEWVGNAEAFLKLLRVSVHVEL